MSKTDMKRDGEKRFRSKMNRKHWRDYRLHELEKQLEFAESRCGTLKQQLDYIKILYGCGKPTGDENEEGAESYKQENQRMLNVGDINLDDLSRWKTISGEYAEDSGEKSLLPQSASWTNTTQASTNSNNKPISSKSSFEKKEIIINIDTKEPSQQKSGVKLKGKKKKTVSKHKLKAKGIETKYSNATCQTKPLRQEAVVEIYKNTAANIESESAADLSFRNKRQKIETSLGRSKKNLQSNERLIPATKLTAFTSFKSLEKVHVLKEECVQTESAETENVPKNEKTPSIDSILRPIQTAEKICFEPEPVKSYCQPTISSKKKRVERNILASLNNINLKNIPFIAATSTAPSHNIGVNIQQVLSIMKKRHTNTNNETAPTLSDQVIGDFGTHLPTGCRGNVQETNEAEPNSGDLVPETELKKRLLDSSKSNTSQRKNSEKLNFKIKSQEDITNENENPDWMCKIHKLKKVLVFLHEDFTTLSQKYRRLQKKLNKRNINKIDAKGELIEIERDLEKKEEEITTVIGLYKEVLHLREQVKKYQAKYNFVAYERALIMDGIKQSNSTHTQMSTLLRKIQQFQDQLKRQNAS